MTLTVALLMAMSVFLDVSGQLAFKAGLDRLPQEDFSIPRFLRRVMGAPLVLAGVAAYGFEFVVWLALLARVPLSIAFPAASLSYCGVVLAGRFVLGERVSRRRCLGTLAVTAGVALIFATNA